MSQINPENIPYYLRLLEDQFTLKSSSTSLILADKDFKLTLSKDPSPSFPIYTLEYKSYTFAVEVNPFTSETGKIIRILSELITEINKKIQ